MKKVLYLIILFAISIGFFSVFIISCKQSLSESSAPSQTELSIRSQQPNYIAELSNNCGPELYPNDYSCGTNEPYTSQPLEIETESGCTVEATMTIQECHDMTEESPVLFMSELSWNFVSPVSSECFNWIQNLHRLPTALFNIAIDELNNEIEDAFVEMFMLDWAIGNSGAGPVNVSTAYFEAPCLQRCVEWQQSSKDYFEIIDQPCAENGCCMRLFSIDVPPADTVYYWGAYQLTSCSNYFQVTCKVGDPLGGCRELDCN